MREGMHRYAVAVGWLCEERDGYGGCVVGRWVRGWERVVCCVGEEMQPYAVAVGWVCEKERWL